MNPRVSFAELCRWPDDGRQYELYDGEVTVVPAPIPRHQRVGSNVESLLREYEKRAGGLMFRAPFDVVLTEYDVVQPDVLFFRAERRHLIDMMEATRVPPDPIGNLIEIYQRQENSDVLTEVCSERDRVDSPTLTGLSFEAGRLFEE